VLADPVSSVESLSGGVTVAQLSVDDITSARLFTVGDARTYNGYYNAPLENSDVLYTVHYVVASQQDDAAVTKMSYSSTARPVAPLPLTTVRPASASTLAVTAVAVSLSVLLLILLVLLLLLVVYRRCCRGNGDASSSPRVSTLNTSWLKYYTGMDRLRTTW